MDLYQLPLAPATIPGCYEYHNHFHFHKRWATPLLDNIPWLKTDCESYALYYKVNISKLPEWNPSLSRDHCMFQPGFSYCVLKTADSIQREHAPSHLASQELTRTEIPHWEYECLSRDWLLPHELMDGTSSNCDCFAIVRGEDVTAESA